MKNKTLFSNVLSLAWNLLLVYVCYFICRLTFLLTNWNLFSEQFEWGYMCRLFGAGIIFDTTAILYSNALFILLFLFPFHWKEREGFYRVIRWVFVIVNTFSCFPIWWIAYISVSPDGAPPRLCFRSSAMKLEAI